MYRRWNPRKDADGRADDFGAADASAVSFTFVDPIRRTVSISECRANEAALGVPVVGSDLVSQLESFVRADAGAVEFAFRAAYRCSEFFTFRGSERHALGRADVAAI